MEFHAYLFFSDGRCRAAFEHYAEILGGELETSTFADAPPGQAPPDLPGDLLMHAALTVPGGSVLMGSDDPSGDGGPMTGIAISLTVASDDEAQRIFDALADGGDVTMPMAEAFWASRFGMCVDRFGLPWMISTEGPAEG